MFSKKKNNPIDKEFKKSKIVSPEPKEEIVNHDKNHEQKIKFDQNEKLIFGSTPFGGEDNLSAEIELQKEIAIKEKKETKKLDGATKLKDDEIAKTTLVDEAFDYDLLFEDE